jgi:hypothetical protein
MLFEREIAYKTELEHYLGKAVKKVVNERRKRVEEEERRR